MFNDMNFWDFSRYFQFQPNVNSINWIGIQAIEGCLIWLHQTNPIETDMTHICKFGSRRFSHIIVTGKLSVSVISLQTLVQAFQSYDMIHISLSGTPRVSLISVTFGPFWRSHIGQPPICEDECADFLDNLSESVTKSNLRFAFSLYKAVSALRVLSRNNTRTVKSNLIL